METTARMAREELKAQPERKVRVALQAARASPADEDRTVSPEREALGVYPESAGQLDLQAIPVQQDYSDRPDRKVLKVFEATRARQVRLVWTVREDSQVATETRESPDRKETADFPVLPEALEAQDCQDQPDVWALADG